MIEPALRNDNNFSGRLRCGSMRIRPRTLRGDSDFQRNGSICNPRDSMVRSPMVAAGKLTDQHRRNAVTTQVPETVSRDLAILTLLDPEHSMRQTGI
ncbi:MAG: hypothetical protein U9N61_05435 [Euryarchaeota archaeon]|nr:hypothetical protein [Euryarchaeota archaeon]